MTAHPIPFKRGQTFALTFVFRDASGAAVDVSQASMSAELRDRSDNIVQPLPVVATGALGEAYTGEMATGGWPLGHLRLDVKYVEGNVITFTETIPIQIIAALTP